MAADKQNDQSQEGLAVKRTQLAQDRTGWAQERTLLAKQRTFAAWVRTGLAALAVGFVGTELLAELEPQWLIRGAGGALIATAAAIFAIAFFGYLDTFRKLREHGIAAMSVWVIGLITLVLVLTALAGLLLVILN